MHRNIKEAILDGVIENDYQQAYKLMIKDKEILQKNYDEYGVTYQATYKKYWKDNPRPKYPKQETLSTYNFEDYKKASAKWDNDEENYMKP